MSEGLFEASKSFLVAALYLGITATGWRHVRERGMARPLTFLCGALFIYQLAEGMSSLTGSRTWDRLELALGPVIAVAALDLIRTLLDRSPWVDAARPLYAGYFGVLGTSTAIGIVDPTDPSADLGPAFYGFGMVLVLVPAAVWLLGRLARQTMRRRGPERLKGQLVMLSCGMGVGGAATDLLAIAGLPVLQLSRPAIALASLALAYLAFQRRLIPTRRLVVINILVVSLLAVAGQAVFLSSLGARIGPVVFGGLFVVLFLMFGLRPAIRQQTQLDARRVYLTTLGRFTAQMAHDLRNPISSIQAISRFALDAGRRGRPKEEMLQDLEQILREAEHMESLVATYQRMGRMELKPAERDLRKTLTSIVKAAKRWPNPDGVRILASFADQPLVVEVDEPLVRAAIENLLRNAWEALEDRGGEIRVTARSDATDGSVEVVVEDDGPGMTPEVLDSAAEDFFSTKGASGGMGLALVRRVAEAHGGRLGLDSRPGEGTRATLTIPGRDEDREEGEVISGARLRSARGA